MQVRCAALLPDGLTMPARSRFPFAAYVFACLLGLFALGGYWYGLGDRVRSEAVQAELAGDTGRAAAMYQKASGLFFMGRFPCPNHPAKERCAVAERETYLKLSQYWAEPIERVEIPFAGQASEGRHVVALVRRPVGVSHPPVVLMWGGVDACKEQMTAACDAFLAQGVATVAIDNAGTGESPIRGVQDAERQFLAVMDWMQARTDWRADRLGLLGRSFGGYWATKLAHLLPDALAGAVNWGGGVHHMFQPSWVQASRYPDSYLMELVETRSLMLGAVNDEEYIAFFKRLSLVDQGLLGVLAIRVLGDQALVGLLGRGPVAVLHRGVALVVELLDGLSLVGVLILEHLAHAGAAGAGDGDGQQQGGDSQRGGALGHGRIRRALGARRPDNSSPCPPAP